MLGEIMQAIPPEQQIAFIVGLLTLVLGGLAGAGVLFRTWFLAKLETNKAELQSQLEDDKAQREAERLKVQAQLDATQSGRETLHMQSIELIESRNAYLSIIHAMREDAIKRDEQSAHTQKELVVVMQGIQANTAGTLEHLKLNIDNDHVIQIRQDILMKQSESVHAKLLDITSSLDTVIAKVDSLTLGQLSDKRVLSDIQGALSRLHDAIKRIEAIEHHAETIPIPNGVIIEIQELSKEFQSNDEKDKPE